MAPLWTCLSGPVSFLCWGPQTRTQYSRIYDCRLCLPALAEVFSSALVSPIIVPSFKNYFLPACFSLCCFLPWDLTPVAVRALAGTCLYFGSHLPVPLHHFCSCITQLKCHLSSLPSLPPCFPCPPSLVFLAAESSTHTQ